MSELTSCNYCDLRQIRSRARQEGKSIIMSSANAEFGLGGTECFIVPKGMKKAQLNELPKEERDKYFAAWFMNLADHCCC